MFKNNDVQVSTAASSMPHASLPIPEMHAGLLSDDPRKWRIPCPVLQIVTCYIFFVCTCCKLLGEGPAELRGPGESGDGPQPVQPVHPGQGHRPLRRGQVRPGQCITKHLSMWDAMLHVWFCCAVQCFCFRLRRSLKQYRSDRKPKGHQPYSLIVICDLRAWPYLLVQVGVFILG